MKELREKQSMKRLAYSTPALLFLLLITVFIARGAVLIMMKEHESAARLSELRENNAALATHEADLQANIASLETPEGVAEAIREKFNAVRPGEHLAVVVTKEPTGTATPPTAIERFEHGWRSFLHLFGF